MKPKIIKLTAIFLLLLFIGAGCKKNEIEIADESIVVDNYPGVSVYKTNGNYFNYISIKFNDDGELGGTPYFTSQSSGISIDAKGNVSYNRRWLLRSGYIVCSEISRKDVFTDITYTEYYNYCIKNKKSYTAEMFRSRVIDENPFIEYYYSTGFNKKYKEFTLGEINQMIENGTLEEHFEKIK
ncbi:MAG: hypothetical protein GXO81_09400 [Chlorobi bacterium]|nr:hypothetical protein [Chlorobiota bacterium]